MRRSYHFSRDESTYRKRRIGDFEYYVSRTGFDGASLVAYRFPCVVSEKTGPDFVLVHGIGVSATSYAPTAAELAKRGEVHLIDMAGYGSSPTPDRNLTIEDHADLIAQYLKDKDLDHPVVVGHSMGTQVVATLAARYPEEIDSLVLIAPVMVESARSLLKAGALILKDGMREPPVVALLAAYDYLFRAGIPYMARQTPQLLSFDIDDTASRVQAKTLIICGLEDPVVPLDWGEGLAERFPRGSFETIPGPHASMFAQPQTIAKLIHAHAYR